MKRIKVEQDTFSFPLYIGGLVLLGSFVNNLITSALPLRLLQPEWQLQMAGLLLTAGTTALIAVLFIHVAESEIHNRDSVMGARARWIRRLAGWAAIAYLLLVPAQIVAGINLVNQRASAEQEPQVLWGKLKARIQATESEKELRKLLERLPSVPQLPTPLKVPISQVKGEIISAVDANFTARRTALEQTANERMQNFLGEAIRNSIQSLLLATGFAALGLQGRKHILSGLLNRLFPFL